MNFVKQRYFSGVSDYLKDKKKRKDNLSKLVPQSAPPDSITNLNDFSAGGSGHLIPNLTGDYTQERFDMINGTHAKQYFKPTIDYIGSYQYNTPLPSGQPEDKTNYQANRSQPRDDML